MPDNEALIDKLLRAGARGVLLKSDAKRKLLDAVATLASHRPFFTDNVTETLLESYLAAPSQSQSILTPREREIVQLIAEGHSNKQFASILILSLKMVETHRAAVMRKLKLSSAAELVRYAVRNKFVEP
jgi:DNA-binding NarL/FixJ family response regulator